MKICWWTIYPNTHQTELTRALRKLGVDVEVCYFGRYDQSRREMGWKERALDPWEHQVRGIGEARRVVPDFADRIQMVPGFFGRVNWTLVLWCVLRRKPWFVVSEGTRGRWLMRPVFHAFCKLVNRFALRAFVIGGPRARQQFSAAGVRGGKIVPFAYATLTPQETNLSDASVRPGAVFVFAGSFCRRKAVDVIAEAWRRLVEEHPESRLVLVGGGDLVDLFKGLAGVEYVGAVRQEEIYGAISRGDVMLLPSRWDPWGASLVEGGMAGLAMVGSDRTGAADSLVEDGKNGFVVRSGDADDLLRVMRLYAADPKLARRHGQEAKVAAERTSGDNLARLMLGFKMGEDL